MLAAVVAVGAVIVGVLVAPMSAQAATPVPTAIAQILSDTNALRAAGGLAPLTESSAMDSVAQNWSAQMFANNALTHNPNYSGQIPSGWSGAAENIASGYTYTSVVEAWHQSAGHYANIMGDYNAIGIGYYESGGQTYFTQDFGKYSTPPSPVSSAPPAPSGNPIGSFDSVSAGLGTATVTGWALDPDTAASITARLYVDNTFAADVTASSPRGDIANAFPGYGAAHGWATTLTLGGGSHNICAYALNAAGNGNNTTLGCRTVTVPTGSPIGSFDSATLVSIGSATVTGWALDPDTAASIVARIYVDNAFAADITAAATRGDLATAVPGYGAAHGWATTLTLSGGPHNICVYGLNAAGGGNNTTLGCRQVDVPMGSPFGSFDSASVAGIGKTTVAGWDIDPDTASAIPTRIYVDNAFVTAVTASDARGDIANAFPAYGAAHGWSATLTLSGGSHNVCAYGINMAASGNNTTLGCRTVYVPTGSPFGSFDSASVVAGGAFITGWDIDPDTAASIPTRIYVDNVFVAGVTASDTRGDIAAAFAGYGAAHGWSARIALGSGSHNICTYAIDTTGPGDNSTIGCRTVTIG
jgi:hypothetical protein